MQPHPRYELLQEIASGDFATVYRALDKELNREVAVKQIHPHFLSDQRQLERYWQEAQLLASLEHPNIMTIYDIDRGRGWLVLELLNGSLLQRAAGQPMELDTLRVALVCGLQALKFLHENGIVHGDVKPSNLLVDKRNWIKLGDFGLAQRAANDQGSLLKGATKYIAPERVNDQLGPVGPASDLYSLGFSLYELMCGEQFEALFPGLGAFGRDKQIAWMMWHAAPDRQAPDISRVLQGVPEDMQYVIQKLIKKNPAERYQSAEQALYDLKTGMGLSSGPSPDELAAQAAAEEEAKKQKRRKMLYIVAACSVLLMIVGFFIPEPEKPTPGPNLRPAEGAIKHLLDDKIVLDNGRTITLYKDRDQLYLNNVVAEFVALKEGNYLRVKIQKDDAGKPYQILEATRAETDRGTITEIRSGASTFVMQYDARDGTTKEMTIFVPDNAAMFFNEKSEYDGRPMTPSDLRADDRVFVRHDDQDERRVALEVRVTRVVINKGRIRGVDEMSNTLTFTARNGDSIRTLTLPFSGTCKVLINGKEFVNELPLRPTDLRAGDNVTVHHDTHIVQVEAERFLTALGIVTDIVPTRGLLQVLVEGDEQPTPFAADNRTQLTLGQESVALEDLQQGDEVEINYDAANPAKPGALSVSATRPEDRTRWAVVIGVSAYLDRSLTQVGHLVADAEDVYDRLTKRYRVADDQALFLQNPSGTAVQTELPELLGRIPPEGRLLVYFAGHSYLNTAGQPLLAPSDFKRLQADQTGLPLKWLIEQVDGCAASEKLILLDTCHTGDGADLKQQPASAEMVEVLYANDLAPLPAKSLVIASCQKGQRGESADGRGEFGRALALALRGDADQNGDTVVDAGEMFSFLTSQLRSRTSGRQAPTTFQPRDAVPNRLSDEVKEQLRTLAVTISAPNFDINEVELQSLELGEIIPNDPEPELLHGLAQLKARDYEEALITMQSAWRKDIDRRLPLEAMVWSLFQRENYRPAISGMVRLVTSIPKDAAASGKLPADYDQLLNWLGRLREYAGTAADDNKRVPQVELEKIDNAIKQCGYLIERSYRQGRDHVQKLVEEINRQISETSDKGDQLLLKIKRQRFDRYATYSIESAVARVLDGMNKN